jgi:hypothetical protein
MSLDKVMRAAANAAPADVLALGGPGGDALAAELVRAARSGAAELLAYLADSGSDDEGDGPKGKGDDDEGGGDHSGHATFKALVRRGMDKGKAGAMCARSDKRVKAAALAEGVVIALAGLAGTEGPDWVEATACDTWAVAALASVGSAPYGDVPYADPGYLPDGKKRYPLDEEHIRAALSYIGQKKNAGRYTSAQLTAMKAKMAAAAKRFGISVSDGQSDADGERAAASMLELAARAMGDGGIPMNHGPFTGTHVHSHFMSGSHAHPHQHVGDSNHDGGPLHRPGSKPQRRDW